MGRVCSVFLSLVGLLALVAGSDAAEGKDARTDLYGDPLPPGAVARLGTMRLRHVNADVKFSTDGKQLISCGLDGDVRVWDAASGKLVRRKRAAPNPYGMLKQYLGQQFNHVALSPDATRAAWANFYSVTLYDLVAGEVSFLPGDSLITAGESLLLTFSANGRMLALQRCDKESDRIIQLWNMPELKISQTLRLRSSAPLTHAVFAPDGKHFAGIGKDYTFRIWDANTGKEISKKGQVALSKLRSLAYSPDGKTLAVGCAEDHQVHLLDTSTWKERSNLKAPAKFKSPTVTELAFSPDGRWLAGAYSDESAPMDLKHGVFVWDLGERKEARRLPGCLNVHLVFAPDGKTLVCRDELERSELCLWDVASGRRLHQWPGHASPVKTLAVSPDGKILASGDGASRLSIWDAATSKPLHALQGCDDWMPPVSCLFSPDGKEMIFASGSNTFQVWNVASGKERLRIQVPNPGLVRPEAVGISADGKCLAAVVITSAKNDSASKWLFVWDLATGKRLRLQPYKWFGDHRLNLHRGIWSRQDESETVFTPDGEGVTGRLEPSKGNTITSIKAWRKFHNGAGGAGRLEEGVGIEEIATGNIMAKLPTDVGGPLGFSPDGRLLAATVLQRKSIFDSSPLEDPDVKGLSLIETATGTEVVRLEISDLDYFAFTPNGRAVVVADPKKLCVWDADTGERLHEMAWPESILDSCHQTKICSLAVLPDGRAATGMADGDILLWDLQPSTWPARKPTPDRTPRELDALWTDLAGDARSAHRAIAKLAATPTQTVPFLREHLQPVALDRRRIEQLLADLNSDQFSTRELATRKLARLRYEADTLLRRAREEKPSLEMRRRLDTILAEPRRPSSDSLRSLRAVAVLERIGTPEARRILEKLSGGADGYEAREAKKALERLKRS